MWDLPGSRMEPVSPALAGRFLFTEPPGKPWIITYMYQNVNKHSTFCDPKWRKGEGGKKVPSAQACPRQLRLVWTVIVLYVTELKQLKQTPYKIQTHSKVYLHVLKWSYPGLLWWLIGKESTCQCGRPGFNPSYRKIRHAVEQLSPSAPTTEPVLQSPGATTTKPGSHNHWSPRT